MNIVDAVIVFGFMAATFFVGSIFYKWVGNADDFYVAGRKLTPFILAAVLTATNVNLYSFVGQAGIVYREGIGIIWQTWTGNMALVFSGLFVLPIFRRLRIKTIPEFLELRYSKGVRTFVAVIWILRLTFWLGVISYTAAIAAIPLTGWDSFTGWILIFSLVAIAYTTLGGMWSVAFTDVMQFVFMLAGALIVLPMAMSQVGWWPSLVAQLPERATALVAQEGTYNWKFILAIFLLGIEWACVDQGLLQRAFGAQNTKTVVRGLVLAGIITTPFALLWNLPGLAARVIEPGLANADMAIPTLLAHLLPHIVLGVVVCGLISSHLSTISANLNGVATIVASDLYESLWNRNATDAQILRMARGVTVLTGVAMIVFAYAVPKLGGAVEAYLTVVAIMDMPLFVIAVVFGLGWRRIQAAGAIAGYAAGATAGIVGMFVLKYDITLTTFTSAAVTLIVTPLVAFVMKRSDSPTLDAVWRARRTSDEEERTGDRYDIIPRTQRGRAGLVIAGIGLLLFFAGVVLGGSASSLASPLAVGGMVLFFAGGLLRAFSD